MPFNNRKKNAQAKLAKVQEKLAALDDARSEANVTLGDAVKFLQGNRLSKFSNAEKIYVGQNPAAEILQTIGSVGVGAVSAYAAWTAAGLGTASTGAAISSLSGGPAIAAKLALLGGGPAVGGMALGVAVMGGIPIALGLLTFGVVSTLNAKKFKKVELMADLAILRINEFTDATKALDNALQQLLVQCSPNNSSDVRTVESISGALAQVVDISITREQDDIPDKDELENAYRKYRQEERREELSGAYRSLREAIASLEYNKAVRAANHILSVITL